MVIIQATNILQASVRPECCKKKKMTDETDTEGNREKIKSRRNEVERRTRRNSFGDADGILEQFADLF